MNILPIGNGHHVVRFGIVYYIDCINLAADHDCGVVLDINVTPIYVAKYHPMNQACEAPESSIAHLNVNTHGAQSIVIPDPDVTSV